MRKATAFIAGFAAVLIAGAAVAQIGSAPAFDVAGEQAVELTEPEPIKTEPISQPKTEPWEKVTDKPVEEASQPEEPAQKEEPKEAEESKPAADEKGSEQPADKPTDKPVEEPKDTSPPPIAIISPANGQVFETKTVRFKGETEPGARVFAGEYEADVDDTGHWSIVLVLNPGGNLATFKAVDAAGNVAKASVEVFWRTEKVEEKDWQFTANQQYGSCGEDIPYDVFWGTGKPGSSILVLSEFGSADTKINEKGHWEVKVLFKEAPVGKTFLVKVKDAFGNFKKFEFTRTG